MIINKLYYLYIVFAVIVFTNCTNTSVDLAGGGSDLEISACAVEGKAVDSIGNVLIGAQVRLRSTDYLSGSTLAIDSTIISHDIKTDSHGLFRFDSIGAGSFIVEINFQDSLGIKKAVSIDLLDTLKHLDIDTLKLLSTISGFIDMPNDTPSNKSTSIQIYGLERQVITDSVGHYSIRVPAGSHRLHICSKSSSSKPVELTVNVDPGESAKMDFRFDHNGHQFQPETYKADSIFLRLFLDSSDLEDISVDSVSTSQYGRITKLNLSNLSLTKTDCLIEKLSSLTDLDLSNNNLGDSIKAVYSFKKLKKLNLKGNRITKVSSNISDLDSLKHLDISDNRISYISQAITKFDFESLDASNNRLSIAAIPEYLIVWLDETDSDWRYTQDPQ